MNLRSLINDLGYLNKLDVNNMLDYPGEGKHVKRSEHRRNCGYYRKSNVDDEIKDDAIPIEPFARKRTLITSRTVQNFDSIRALRCNKKS